MTDEQITFEQALARLEEMVSRLEAGNLSLEESIALFEEGMRLAQVCGTRLDEAELRVSQLVAGPDGYRVEPFA
ncbi:MAG: exodeoxyribonuclease VII small subunit [Chloroflexi bacterium]|nr:exodeoxyribonuclease VII small subunit [Chloroflexota bacterium]MBU1746765.1 exodeoxyribonuclease VII small subunit [Chloroflexota bacterium]MBU1877533.1 exodeoxyribonuclease VII small subunit [Chloroflexota bacterium]